MAIRPRCAGISFGLDTGGGGGMKGLMEVGLKRSGLSLTLDLEERKEEGGEEGCFESHEMTTVRKGREQI